MIIDLLQWAGIIYLFFEVKKLKDIHKGHPGI